MAYTLINASRLQPLLPPPSPSAHICTMRWLFWDNQWVVKSLRGRLDEENKMRDRMKFLLSHDSFLGLSLWWGFCFCCAGGPAAPFFLVSHPREGPKEAKSGIICFWLIAPWTVRFYTQGLPPPFFFLHCINRNIDFCFHRRKKKEWCYPKKRGKEVAGEG